MLDGFFILNRTRQNRPFYLYCLSVVSRTDATEYSGILDWIRDSVFIIEPCLVSVIWFQRSFRVGRIRFISIMFMRVDDLSVISSFLFVIWRVIYQKVHIFCLMLESMQIGPVSQSSSHWNQGGRDLNSRQSSFSVLRDSSSSYSRS